MPTIELTIIRQAGGWSRSMRAYRTHIEQWVKATAKELPRKGAISIVLTDDASMKVLNHTYRGKNKATNVLSFNGDGDELGDIVLAYETVKKEARDQEKSFLAHSAHLIVHGCLHLVGYDHENDKDAGRMERKEISILAELGFDNPYEATA